MHLNIYGGRRNWDSSISHVKKAEAAPCSFIFLRIVKSQMQMTSHDVQMHVEFARDNYIGT
jgi:hypothetical protein